MASLGTFTILAAFVVSAYAAAAAVVGARRGSHRLVDSAIGAFHLVATLMAVATAVIVHAFVTDDYSIKYVHHYSDSLQPFIYKLTSYWGGLDGSLLFWAFLLAIFGSAAVHVNRWRHRELVPYVVATISLVQVFFLLVMVVHSNPFSTYLVTTPVDGRGLNPLLQNPYMVTHPPALYVGFVGMTIPYAFGMAALVTGRLDDAWLRAVRRWTMVSWLFLSFGLALGMIWAYEVLGWGGYWGWDPVENAGLLPWLTATAFLHSVVVQERRGMLRVWNVTLVVSTFFLTIFGTFMTRSGVVQSVHAFGEDRQLAWMFSVFMAIILAASFGLIIYRLPRLRSRRERESWFSREAAFLVNNWVLLFTALFVLFATMLPTLSEAATGERLTVGPPFFNRWMLPIGLIVLLLTGVGPLLAWRRTTPTALRRRFSWAVAAAVLTPLVVWLAGVRSNPAVICFAVCAFVFVTIVQEFLRGAAVRHRASGSGRLTALLGMVTTSTRRYGGYLVHLGIVLMFLGFAGEALKVDEQMLLRPGQTGQVGRYAVRHDGVRVTDDGQKQMVTGHLAVLRDGQETGAVYPARWFYRKHEQEPVSRIAIRRGLAEDLYVVMPGFDPKDQSITLQVVLTPLVTWIWIGFGVLVLGTLVAMLPDRVPTAAGTRQESAHEPTPRVAAAAEADATMTGVRPWHVFLVLTLLASSASAIAVGGTAPSGVILVCLAVMAAGGAAYAVYRTLWPIVRARPVDMPDTVGGRTRTALEREEVLTLRTIKDLEFDRAMGKVSEDDWEEMTGRLRERAAGLNRQLGRERGTYREIIERELAARRPARELAPGAAGSNRGGTSGTVLAVMLALGTLLGPGSASAQMGGVSGMGGVDARSMSGIPLESATVPPGSVSLRLVRARLDRPLTGQPVAFLVNGASRDRRTDETGRVVLDGVPGGATVQVVAVVGSQRLESQTFQMPAQSGIALLLVAGGPDAPHTPGVEPAKGVVVLGGQSRVMTQFDEDTLHVFYVLEFVNASEAPILPEVPIVFDLPDLAEHPTVLEGSSPQAVVQGARVTVQGPLQPGTTSVHVAYAVTPAARVVIRQRFPVAWPQTAVVIERAGALVVASPQITTLREMSDEGKTFLVGSGGRIRAGDHLEITLSGMPHEPVWPRVLALLVGTLVLGAGAWGTVRTGGASSASARHEQLGRRREEIFQELVALDGARSESGGVDTERARRRETLIDELERLYGELDTDDGMGERGAEAAAR